MTDTDRSFPADQPYRARFRLGATAAGVAFYLLSVLLSRLPVAAEIVAVPVSLAGWGLARISGLFPFALAEALLVAYAVWRIAGFARGLGRVLRRH